MSRLTRHVSRFAFPSPMSHELLFRRNAVRECLRAGRRKLHRLVIAEDGDLAALNDILAEARRRKLPLERTAKKELNLATHGEPHQNVLLEVGPYPYVDLSEILDRAVEQSEPPFILLLDLVQDPRNVGALLRTAEAAGV